MKAVIPFMVTMVLLIAAFFSQADKTTMSLDVSEKYRQNTGQRAPLTWNLADIKGYGKNALDMANNYTFPRKVKRILANFEYAGKLELKPYLKVYSYETTLFVFCSRFFCTFKQRPG
jgi:hypothetical protein